MRAIVFSVVRLFVVFSVVRLIGAIPSTFSSVMTYSGSIVKPNYVFRVDIPYFLAWLLYAAVLALIWFKAEAIIQAVVGTRHESRLSWGGIELRDLIEAGLIILGLYVIIDSLPELVNHLGFFLYLHIRHVPADLAARTTSREGIALLGVMLKVAFASFLIAKRSLISGIVNQAKKRDGDLLDGE